MAAESAKKSTSSALVPIGIIGIVLMMILPLPPALLDVLVSLSMALSIGVFLTALFIEQALELGFCDLAGRRDAHRDVVFSSI